jgi:hypothetical protein
MPYTRNDITQPTQCIRNDLAMDMLVVGREGTMDMMNGESAISSLREKKQEGEKKSEKRNFELSSHTVYGTD